MRIAVVSSSFYPEIAERMLAAARERAAARGAEIARVCSVAGTFDIPAVADALLARDDVDAVVALGAVIKGQTKHDEVISHATASALLAVSVGRSKPVSLGITGPAMRERQAYARIRPVAEHAVDAAIASRDALREARA